MTLLQPDPPYRFDLLAVFSDPEQALDVVPKIMQAGINLTMWEYMDTLCARYGRISELASPHSISSIYVIITVRTFQRGRAGSENEQLDELCGAVGAVDVLEADERIWDMVRNCQESVRLINVSLTMTWQFLLMIAGTIKFIWC